MAILKISAYTNTTYSTTLNFGVSHWSKSITLRDSVSSAGAYQRIVSAYGNFRSKFSIVQ